MNETFSIKLKKYRKELENKRGEKVGQVQFAKELGISKGNLGDFESGRRAPSKSFLVKLCKHSDKSLAYWMDGVSDYEAPNSVDLVLDKMIEANIIKDTNISDEAWEILKKAVILEIERKLS